jgi:hypothetical protein
VLKYSTDIDFSSNMDTISKAALRLTAQINKFSGILCHGLSKTRRRFFKDVLYVMQVSKHIMLGNSSRALQENMPLCQHFY